MLVHKAFDDAKLAPVRATWRISPRFMTDVRRPRVSQFRIWLKCIVRTYVRRRPYA